ncbi:MAG: histidine triad nucleotide-binding protein [Candidatus Moraniibacteriota bacterium]|nr:MAG: histidine triad nucleotide-binding protein [Candidatus Moranbacteria bacterium]
MKDCVFCKITRGEVLTELHYESKNVIAFSDINPVAPVHILIIPVEHVESANDLEKEHYKVIGEMFLTAKQLAKENDIADSGYKLLIRTGADGGQEVPHLHLHLIGGAPLSEDIHPK